MKKIKTKVVPKLMFNVVNGLLNLLKKLQQKILPPNVLLINYTTEYIVINRCLYVVAELGIAEFLKDGPKKIDYLAEKTNANEDTLYRVMRVLAGEGIFKESKDRYFETTRIGKTLELGRKDSIAQFTKWVGSESIFGLWVDLMKTVKTGKSYFENNFGEGFFDWLKKNSQDQEAFNNCLEGFSIMSNEFIAHSYDFSVFNSLVDIAGGRGSQIISILKAYPKLKGAIFELPLTVDSVTTDKVFEKNGLANRMEIFEGNFFQSIVPGYDGYFMKSILHDWDDENALKILSNCRKAMHNNSKLLISEMVINDGNKPHFGKIFDICMGSINNGRERTRADYSILLEKAGFKMTKIIPTSSPYSIIEAVPHVALV